MSNTTTTGNAFDAFTDTPRVTMLPTPFPSIPPYPYFYDGYEPGLAWNYTDVQPEPTRTSVEHSSGISVQNISFFIYIAVVFIGAMVPMAIVYRMRQGRQANDRSHANHHEHNIEVGKNNHDLHVSDGRGGYPTSYAADYAGCGDVGGVFSGGNGGGFDGACGGGDAGGGGCGM